MTEYRKRMHALHPSSRSPFKRKWNTLATLGRVDKQLHELILPRKFSVPSAAELLRIQSPPRSQRNNFYMPPKRAPDSGLKFISFRGDGKADNPDGVLRRQYKVRASDSDNPELTEYKKNVAVAANTPAQVQHLQMGQASVTAGRPKWEELYEATKMKSHIVESIDREAAILEEKLRALRTTREKAWETEERQPAEAFTRLSEEDQKAIDDALCSRDRDKVLVSHLRSNIDITGAIIECLLPGAWLNDEVINVYMELLKERELREPNKFLRCHFFNTFFYNKLFKDRGKYDYKAVRRWTTQKKLGYSLLDCDKILVPVHQNIHWCLAVINLRERKLEYLDSLKGVDEDVLDALARYIVDEARDKSGKVPDVENWEHEYPTDIPEQMNGCDCGMFMLKYADFHSRGAPLSFTQEDMAYFRRRTVWEILNLKAT